MHTDERLSRLVAPVVEALALEMWGVEVIPQGHKKIVRIYIDSQQGVGLSECESVSRQLSALFDVEEPVSGNYTLEVSSPGMDRPLYHEAQFKRFVGSEVKVKLQYAFEGRRNYKGILVSVENAEVGILVDDTEYTLPLETIERANVVPHYPDKGRSRGN